MPKEDRRNSHKKLDSVGRPIKTVKVFRSDTKQVSVLKAGLRKSAVEAVNASKNSGLPVTYMENGVIYVEDSKGNKSILKNAKRSVSSSTKGLLKKGTILHAKK